jgi:hypothetical protein
MKSARLHVVQVCSLLLCVCCFGADQIKTTYHYKGFDTNGALVVEGVLSLSINNTNRVEGEWKLHEVKPEKIKNLGNQIGSGKLAGQINESKINLDLNPGWADNNVLLNGEVTTTNIFGTWGFYGFAGEIVGGKFEAVKK